MKRATHSRGEPVSPPPTKRKVESTTTSRAVASFFKPTSQKAPEKLIWRTTQNALIIGRYANSSESSMPLARPVKIAAFDLDDTLIKPKQGGTRFVRNINSHMWWDPVVPGRLKQLQEEGYLIVILTNQGAISLKDNAKALQRDSLSLKNFKDSVATFLRQLDIPISVYAATGNDHYRKPRIGMWSQVREDFDLDGEDAVDMEGSFYIGDAAGREKTDQRQKDHAVSDRDLASNIGIKFQTPEEFFLGLETEPHDHPFDPKQFLQSALSSSTPNAIFTKQHAQELVLFVGSPGAGKSSFFWNVLEPQGFRRVNQDILKSRDKCLKMASQYLDCGSSVAVDNTNRDKETRAYWTKLAQSFSIPIRCVLFTASARLCEHNDVFRAHSRNKNPENRTILPPIAFRSFAQSYIPPSLDEGYQDITTINFEFEGTDEDRMMWSKYWVSKFST